MENHDVSSVRTLPPGVLVLSDVSDGDHCTTVPQCVPAQRAETRKRFGLIELESSSYDRCAIPLSSFETKTKRISVCIAKYMRILQGVDDKAACIGLLQDFGSTFEVSALHSVEYCTQRCTICVATSQLQRLFATTIVYKGACQGPNLANYCTVLCLSLLSFSVKCTIKLQFCITCQIDEMCWLTGSRESRYVCRDRNQT